MNALPEGGRVSWSRTHSPRAPPLALIPILLLQVKADAHMRRCSLPDTVLMIRGKHLVWIDTAWTRKDTAPAPDSQWFVVYIAGKLLACIVQYMESSHLVFPSPSVHPHIFSHNPRRRLRDVRPHTYGTLLLPSCHTNSLHTCIHPYKHTYRCRRASMRAAVFTVPTCSV